MEFIDQHWQEVLTHLLTFAGGLLSGLSIRVVKNARVDRGSYVVTQEKITAGGDVAGRDIRK